MAITDKDKETIASIAWLISLPQWREHFLPNVTGLLSQAMVQLSLQDRGKVSDDYIRGQIAVYRWLIEGIPAKLEELARSQTEDDGKLNGQPVGHPYGEDNPPDEEK